MSLDRLQSKQGFFGIYPENTSGGFPGGVQLGAGALVAQGVAATNSGGAIVQVPREKVTGDIPTIAGNGTITHNQCGMVVVTTGGAVTGIIVQAGQVHGQSLVICNNSANTLTMAAAGTSNVAAGTAAIVPATAALHLMWNAIDSRWYDVG